eukprot:7106583-Prymnesium_polylepis.1
MEEQGIGYAVLTGTAFKKCWVGDDQPPPQHHLYDDGDLYHYSGTDGLVTTDIMQAYDAGGSEAIERFAAMACGFNLGDYGVEAEAERALKNFPFVGFGEVRGRVRERERGADCRVSERHRERAARSSARRVCAPPRLCARPRPSHAPRLLRPSPLMRPFTCVTRAQLTLQSDDINNMTVKGGNWTHVQPAASKILKVAGASTLDNMPKKT